jgi:hypothetical protein
MKALLTGPRCIVIFLSLCFTSGVITGCASYMTSSSSSQMIGQSTALTAKLTTSNATPVSGTAIALKWSSENASIVEIEGEDLFSSTLQGEQNLVPTHSIVYFMGASNDNSFVTQTVTVNVDVPIAQQQMAHTLWWSGLDAVTLEQGCENNVVTQQNKQALQDVLIAAQTENAFCIVLQPSSQEADPIYYIGLASSISGVKITYISDVSDVLFPNPDVTSTPASGGQQ